MRLAEQDLAQAAKAAAGASSEALEVIDGLTLFVLGGELVTQGQAKQAERLLDVARPYE